MSQENEEKAVAPRGLGMGGLGDFTSGSFQESLEDAATTKGSATGDQIRDAMGNRRPKLPRLKVKHSAGVFAKDDGSRVEELQGVVVAHNFNNSFFQKAFADHAQGERPDCFSNDATTIAPNAEDPQAQDCTTCNRNRDAREKEAREAAFARDRQECCNNYLTLAFAVPGEEIPYVVQLSNQSFGPWAEYVQEIGAKGRFLPHEVGTSLVLEVKKGPGGSEYSKAKFRMLGALPENLRGEFLAAHLNYRTLLQREAENADREEQTASAAEAVREAREAEAAAAKDDGGAAL